MNIKIGNIQNVVLQRTGNKNKGDGVTFANEEISLEDTASFLQQMIEESFDFKIIQHFTYISSVELNPLYTFVTKIFNDTASLVKQANNIAAYLYDQSIHPNIQSGEFYVVYLESCQINNKETSAIAMFKTETKESYLTVSLVNEHLTIHRATGISNDSIDKGCIIFNVEKEDGFRLAVIDKKSNRDAHYWTDNFLHSVAINNSYYQTNQFIDTCKAYAKSEVKKGNLQSELDMASFLIKGKELLLSTPQTDVNSFAACVFEEAEAQSSFLSFYKAQTEKMGLNSNEVITIDIASVDKLSPLSRRKLKLGHSFEVIVKDNNTTIEQGYDPEVGMNFCKLYYS